MITFKDICHLYLISHIIILLYFIFIFCHVQHIYIYNPYIFVVDLYNLTIFIMYYKMNELYDISLFSLVEAHNKNIILIYLWLKFTSLYDICHVFLVESFLQSKLKPAIFIL